MVEAQSSQNDQNFQGPPSKVIVVAGFLGSGKTTLINQILKAPQLQKRVAVIQNEFSPQMGLESTLMKDSNGDDIEDFYEMPNGCICCAAKDDLIQTLDSLLENNIKSGKPKLEYIVVETNGLADPCQVVQTFWLDDGLQSKVQLHSCVSLIDARDFTAKLESTSKRVPDESQQNTGSVTTKESDFPENELLLRQLIFADRILINKIDKLPQDIQERQAAIQLVEKAIQRVNTQAEVQQTEYSQVDLDALIGQARPRSNAAILESEDYMQKTHDLQHRILNQIQSIYITIEVPVGSHFDVDEMTMYLGTLIWEAPEHVNILRCKGLFQGFGTASDAMLGQYMLQGVGDVFELRPMAEVAGAHEGPGKFLFVGRGIDKVAIESGLAACVRPIVAQQ